MSPPPTVDHSDTLDFQKMFELMSQAATKTMTAEAKIAQDIADIKKFLQGPPEKPGDGLLWRVSQIETQMGFFKRWSLVAILVLVGGQPVVERILPAAHSNDAVLQAIYAFLESQVDTAGAPPAQNPTRSTQ